MKKTFDVIIKLLVYVIISLSLLWVAGHLARAVIAVWRAFGA